MDGDLQNDPADIPKIIDVLKNNNEIDLVAGWRKDRQDSILNRKLPSMFANYLISYTTGIKLRDYGCSLKGYRRELVSKFRLYGEMHRFIPAGIKRCISPYNLNFETSSLLYPFSEQP